MTCHRIATALAAALIAAAPAWAQEAPAPAAPPSSAAAPAPPAPPPAPKSRIICRREIEIGSLVKGVRRCATAEDWRRSSEAARATTERIQSDKGRYCAPGQTC